MDELTIPETRSRSRSKTPFLRSSCDRETCTEGGDHIHKHTKKSPMKKSPGVETIREEIMMNPTIGQLQRKSKLTTSDYSSDDGSSVHFINGEKQSASTSSEQSSTNVVTTSRTVVTTSRTEHHTETTDQSKSKKTTRSKATANRSKETDQNRLNRSYERERRFETSSEMLSPILPSREGVNGNLNKHLAYKEYTEAGEYWNKYPKTDYTYSKLSPHRRELADGHIAMPNMSRKSLDHHLDRVDVMVQRHPDKASYIRTRYLSKFNQGASNSLSQSAYYDSQDEIDEGKYSSSYYSERKETIFRRIYTSIISTFYSFINLFRSSKDTVYYRRVETEQKRNFLSRFLSFISGGFLSLFSYVYMFVSSALYLDSYLLQTGNAENRAKKRFLLILLLLLPLLLLSGIYYYLDIPVDLTNINHIVDPIHIENMKVELTRNVVDLYDLSTDYLLHAKGFTNNLAEQVQKVWAENFAPQN